MEGIRTATTSFKNQLFGYKVLVNGYQLGGVCSWAIFWIIRFFIHEHECLVMGGSTLTQIHLKRKQVCILKNVVSLLPQILNFYAKTFSSCIDIHGPTLHSIMMFINLTRGPIKYLKDLCMYEECFLVQKISQNIVFCINIKINSQP